MEQLAHITGILLFGPDGKLAEHKEFPVETRDALLHAAAIGNNDEVRRIMQSDAITDQRLYGAMQELLQQRNTHIAVIREANIMLTKQQLRERVTPDLLIINTSNTMEELDKVCNALAKRLREWYALYDPELEHAYHDHRAFIEAILARTSARTSDTMGGELGEPDLAIILEQASAANALYLQRDKLLEYLEAIMQRHTPNIKRVATSTIGAKLLAMAGSLERMSRMPSSTIQLLGAETALFRHLRNNKARPPKHGIIFNHLLLQRAPKNLRGKVARALADKISIASRVDFFKGEFVGDTLYQQIEDKIKEAGG